MSPPRAGPAEAAALPRRGSTSWHSVGPLAAEREHLRQLHAAATADVNPTAAWCAPRHPRPPEPRRPWASALIVFSGEGHDLDLAAQLRTRGLRVEAYDTKAGGESHDVLRHGLGDALVARTQRGDFDVVFLATPCSSYSVRHRPRLRSRRHPEGLPSAPPEWRRYLDKHNRLAALTGRLITAAQAAGAAWALENPADRGDRASPAWWPEYVDHGPIWLVEPVRRAIRDAGGQSRTFAQCAFGGRTQKWTTIAHSGGLAEWMAPLDDHGCRHGRVAHDEQASGRRPDGSSRAADAAAYPVRLNAFLADALAAWARRRFDGRRRSGPAPAEGGHVEDGHALGEDVAAACEAARLTPPRFASLRNRSAEDRAVLRHEALPGALHDPSATTKPPVAAAAAERRRAAERAARAASGPQPEAAEMARPAREARIAAGPIAIHQLYLDGVYEAEIASWLRDADAAVADLRAGRASQRVPTRIITQEQMQPWARGVVWDCADPADCRPVARSTRDTVFRGERQLDRAALRRIAAELDWHDDDIVAQCGEGGVEVRSACALDTVLSFHHLGLREHVDAAARVVAADQREDWVDRPVRHLPFAPCRVLPRNVVQQERSRLVPDPGGGAPSLELYLKPRVTMDSSAGGDLAVNAGVAADERYVLLPSVQSHARGLAICDSFVDGPDGPADGAARAGSYVVDAESAYRFCPVQEADLWTQCFLWWGDDGAAGICVDRRLGFGGAFAPNRFERVSTLVAAHVQAMQEAFDRTAPLPPAAARCSAERYSLQVDGRLPRHSSQLWPAHRQVYIDDLSGSTLDDEVTPPAEVAEVTIDPSQIRVEGGVAAAHASRLHVHARLAVLGLRAFGLSAAPGKVVAGDPVIVLGLRVSRASWRVDCPALKRASMLADIDRQREAAEARLEVSRRPAERLVGRCGNLSQVLPELQRFMHGGYAVTMAAWAIGGRRRRPPNLQLARGSGAFHGWLELLDVARQLISDNDGVQLAPARAFPGRDEPGTLTVTSDASGVDGVGGYAFDASDPGTVWLVSEPWPADILAALHAASAEGGASGKETWGLSMPAAELFGSIAVTAAVAAARSGDPTAVIAVGDCAPAAGALNSATSGNPQMRTLLREAFGSLWLGVAVPRASNSDADRLSHPARLPEVLAAAAAAGLAVRVAAITDASWAAVRRAAALGVGRPRR